MIFKQLLHFKEIINFRKTQKETKHWTSDDWTIASTAAFVRIELAKIFKGQQAHPHFLDSKYIKEFLKMIGGNLLARRSHFHDVLVTGMSYEKKSQLPLTIHLTRFNWYNLSEKHPGRSAIIEWKDSENELANLVVNTYRILSRIEELTIGGKKQIKKVYALHFMRLIWVMHPRVRKRYRNVVIAAMDLEDNHYLPK